MSDNKVTPWDSWTAEELKGEVLDRITHFYADISGKPTFPNSAEGDLLKLTYHFILQLPDDMILLPREPTEAFLSAASLYGMGSGDAKKVWEVMIKEVEGE